MEKKSRAILVGVVLGLAAVLLLRARRRKPSSFEMTTEDLTYQDRSAEELAAENLMDLNMATSDQLLGLGLARELVDRIVEGRPYRNKLELVSRMVLIEEVYKAIKDKVGVARAKESVKVA